MEKNNDGKGLKHRVYEKISPNVHKRRNRQIAILGSS